jgi:type IX secretion system PorP/SprF family membrane protein
MLRKLLGACALALAAFAANAQDPHFSQFYANSLYLNPALAGSGLGPRISLNYRNQWPALQSAYVTYAAGYDQYFNSISGGIGLHVLSDRAGDGVFLTNQFSAMYANNLNINRKLALKTGFQVGYAQKSLNWNRLIFPDQIDPRTGFSLPTQEQIPASGKTQQGYVDFSAGMVLSSERYFGGLAVHHITTPNESLLGPSGPEALLPRRLTIHGGANIDVVKKKFRRPATTVSPNILYMSQAKFNELNLGVYINRGPIVGGMWFRNTSTNSDALILLAGVTAGVFRFGYSYDITVSRLRSATDGAHEISTILQFPFTPGNRKTQVNKVKCPAF